MAPVPRPPKPGRPPFRKGGSNTPPPFMSPGGPPGLSVPPKTGSPKPVPTPKPKGAVMAYGERNPPDTGPKDPEPSPGTGRLPLPKPKPPRPRGIPGGGEGGAAPPGFGGPRRIPPAKAKPSYGEASILRFITTKPRPK